MNKKMCKMCIIPEECNCNCNTCCVARIRKHNQRKLIRRNLKTDGKFHGFAMAIAFRNLDNV